MTWVKGHVGDGLIAGIDFMAFMILCGRWHGHSAPSILPGRKTGKALEKWAKLGFAA